MIQFRKKIYLPNLLSGLWVTSILLWGIAISPILRSSWAGDDWPNSQFPYWIEWRKGSLNFALAIEESIYWIRGWILGQGRFFPLSSIEAVLQFSYLRELWQYKLLQFFLLFICGVLFAVLIYMLSKSKLFAICTLFSLSLTTQFRAGFDPHLAFSSMVSSMLIKVFLASIIINYVATNSHKIKSLKLSYISALIYFAAMSTYEFAFLLFPIILISYKLGIRDMNNKLNVFSKTRWLDQTLGSMFTKNFRPVLYSWLFYGILVFVLLRNIAKDIGGSYVLGISLKSIPVFISQIPAGFPLLQFWIDTLSKLPNIEMYLVITVFIAVLIIIQGLKFSRFRGKNNYNQISSFPLLLISLVLIFTPGIMLALQVSWWDIANIKNTYLGVMLTEFGTALLITLFIDRFIHYTFKNQKNENN